MNRRTFLKATGAGIWGFHVLGGTAAVLDSYDEFEGPYTIGELSGNMHRMEGTEIDVEGYPAPLFPQHELIAAETGDYDTTFIDGDLEDDDGLVDTGFWDDVGVFDVDWHLSLYESSDGGTSIRVIDENRHFADLVADLDSRVDGYGSEEISDLSYLVKGDIDKRGDVYALEVDEVL